jgi:hypothetical protein
MVYAVIVRSRGMDALKKFDLDHWWNLLAAVGVIIALAFLVAQLTHGFLFGLGLLLLGTGERINHPRRSEIVRDEIVSSSTATEGNLWQPNPFGLSLDALGVGLFTVGLLLAIFAP